MSDTLLEPISNISLAGRTYQLNGHFTTLKAIQQALQLDILVVQATIRWLRLDQIVLLLTVAINSSGGKVSESEIGSLLLEEVGVAGPEYKLLQLDLMAWLAIAVTPKQEREKKRQKMLEIREKAVAEAASPGPTTNASASESSDGPLQPSGPATSGT